MIYREHLKRGDRGGERGERGGKGGERGERGEGREGIGRGDIYSGFVPCVGV